jgi:hypothetical protein
MEPSFKLTYLSAAGFVGKPARCGTIKEAPTTSKSEHKSCSESENRRL